MLFEIIALVLCILLPVCSIFAYRLGINDGAAIKAGTPLETVTPTHAHSKATPSSDERINTILTNINGYDGTSGGQLDV